MARPRLSRCLSVWMNGERVGSWLTPARGSHEFRYAESWIGSNHARPISLSLPLRPANKFMRTQLVFWLLAAIDGHAKNFSLFLLPGGAFRLTPRYDVLSAHPVVGHGRGKLARQKVRMAMAVFGKNRHYRWAEIERRHWMETGKACGFPGMARIVDEVMDRTPSALEAVRTGIPKDFPGSLSESILAGVAAAVKDLVSG